MEAVINPWWFYWLEVSGSVKGTGFIFACIFTVISVVLLILTYSEIEETYEEDRALKLKYCKICTSIAVASIFISIFTPSSNTLVKMAVAQNVTVDRVAVAQDVAVKVYNDIIGLTKENK